MMSCFNESYKSLERERKHLNDEIIMVRIRNVCVDEHTIRDNRIINTLLAQKTATGSEDRPIAAHSREIADRDVEAISPNPISDSKVTM